jgi:metal-dependent amidase/aminoacylase/carboxypeptidase family protein
MRGTARWFKPEVGEAIEAGVRRIATGIAASLGASAEVKFTRHAPATVNDEEATTHAVRAAYATAGEARVRHMGMPTMGGEDFAYMLNAKQGAYLMLGGGRTANDPRLHHPRYDFNDDILPVGASWWSMLVEQLLPKGGV